MIMIAGAITAAVILAGLVIALALRAKARRIAEEKKAVQIKAGIETWMDPETGVEYILKDGAMSPRYNADGTLKVNGGGW